MNSEVWGPHAWIFLHSVTMTYPQHPNEIEKQQYKNFFLNLQNVLPCDKCQEHYIENLKKLPIDNALHSRNDFVEWFIKIHNEVNKVLNKPILTYDEVMKEYNKLYYGNKKESWIVKHHEYFTTPKILLYIAIILLIIWLIVRYNNHIKNYAKYMFSSTKSVKYY